MIAKRINHKGECDHAQTPAARRKCRATKLATQNAEEATMQPDPTPSKPTIIDGHEIPDNAADVRDWYSYAADLAAGYAEDDNSRAANNARNTLRVARKAMELFGLPHGGPR